MIHSYIAIVVTFYFITELLKAHVVSSCKDDCVLRCVCVPRPNFKMANWEAYADEIKLKYNDPAITENPTLEEIDAYIEDWYTTIETAVRNNIPHTINRNKNKKKQTQH